VEGEVVGEQHLTDQNRVVGRRDEVAESAAESRVVTHVVVQEGLAGVQNEQALARVSKRSHRVGHYCAIRHLAQHRGRYWVSGAGASWACHVAAGSVSGSHESSSVKRHAAESHAHVQLGVLEPLLGLELGFDVAEPDGGGDHQVGLVVAAAVEGVHVLTVDGIVLNSARDHGGGGSEGGGVGGAGQAAVSRI